MTHLIAFLQANEKSVRAVCWALLAVFAGATLFVDNHHAHTWVERHVPFFWSFFGFGAAALTLCASLTGVLEIAGASSPWLIWFAVAGCASAARPSPR